MTRTEKIKLYLEYIDQNKQFLANNSDRLTIYRGKLMPYVLKILKETLSENYFNQIKERVIPINVLTRIINKLSKVYSSPPIRKASNKANQDFVDRAIKESRLDTKMSVADAYSHLFKGYAIEPYLDRGKIQVRILPYDRFLPLSLDEENPLRVTDMIKFMGKDKFFAYTDTEFYAFNSKGEELTQYYDGNGGLNFIKRIPMIYGSRSEEELVPTEDTDLIQMTKMIPVLLSDLAGAIMFQCFTIIYGINVKKGDLKMSPNAFWDLKSDEKSETTPSVGTIKPEADIDKVLSFITKTFVFWLETKGVRIGSLNNVDAGNTSGIAKIIDEMDVYEIKKEQISYFKKEESELWSLMRDMNNYWLASDDEYKSTMINDELEVEVTFDEPRPEIPRSTQVETVDKEYKGGYLDSKSAIKELYPDLDDKDVEERALELDRVSRRGEFSVEETKLTDDSNEENNEHQLPEEVVA